jgi:TonB-linked SusC/RagA family outer membrane protein
MIVKLLRKMFMPVCLFLLGTVSAIGQTGSIQGVVTDKTTKETLPGANVYIEGTTLGISTDLDGRYKLEDLKPGPVTLTVSFIGYKKSSAQVTVLAGQTVTHDFAIETDQMMLNELVVVGYGTQRKMDITSSISSVKVQEITDIPVPTFETALQGRAPGVQVTQDNGTASAPVTVRVRGTSSIYSSSQPLYVIDGVPVITGSFTSTSGYPDKSNVLSLINPNDIQSIEVLKDASAAAIYGSRSANGVVLITTKQGKAGKTKFNVGYYYGLQDVTHKLEVLDGPEYLQYTKEAWTNSYIRAVKHGIQANIDKFDTANNYAKYWNNLAVPKETAQKTNTDWIDQTIRTGKVQSAYLNATGGTEKTRFFIGGGYDKTNGILVNNDFERINARVKVDNNAFDWLSVGMNIGVTYGTYVQVPTGWAGGLGTAQSRSLPIVPVYDTLGGPYYTLPYNPEGFYNPRGGTNVVAYLHSQEYKAYQAYLLGGAYADIKFTKNLSFRTEFGLNDFFQRETMYESTLTREDAHGEDRRVQAEKYDITHLLNYSKVFNDVHNLGVMLGMSVESYSQYTVGAWGEDFPSPELKNPNSGTRRDGYGDQTGYGFLSYFGRVNYAYKEKYQITASVRRDGSSRFGPDRRYGTFPAVSVGWIISQEKFWKVPVLTYLKLRASYGNTGNAEIGNFRYIGLWGTRQYNGEGGIGPDNIGNPDLHWEESSQFDVGIDYGLLEGRISGGLDYYYKYTYDMLLQKNIPQTTGMSNVLQNVGKMQNQGFEFFITSNNLVREFKWTTDINLSTNANKILDIEGQIISGPDAGGTYGNNIAVEGHPIGAWQLVEYYGVQPEDGSYTITNSYYIEGNEDPSKFDPTDISTYQYGPQKFEVSAEGGDPLFINQYGEITPIWDFDKDAGIFGNPYPTIYGGVNNTLSYKGFELSFMFTFSIGNDVYRDDGKFFEGGNLGSNWNQMSIIKDRWQQPGDITDQPILLWDSQLSTYNITRYLDDASYLRLKTITLGYSFPASITSKLKLDKLRLYIMGTNILTFTSYPGWDPEVNRDNSANVTQGVTYLSPPQAKTVTFGIDLGF